MRRLRFGIVLSVLSLVFAGNPPGQQGSGTNSSDNISDSSNSSELTPGFSSSVGELKVAISNAVKPIERAPAAPPGGTALLNEILFRAAEGNPQFVVLDRDSDTILIICRCVQSVAC